MGIDGKEFKRRSIRLPGYDYSKAGAYFVTVCVQFRHCLLGEIVSEEMQLKEPGWMVEKWWKELMKKLRAVEIDEYSIMPNHLHGILILVGDPRVPTNVGAALCGRPKEGHPHRGAPTLGDMMDWFKTMTTNEYIKGVKQRGWPPFQGRLWQRNYYEHIIRNEDELEKIREYIIYNPSKWATDRENPETAQSLRDHRDEMDIILECNS